MRKRIAYIAFAAATAVAACSPSITGSGGNPAAPGFVPQARSSQGKIQHIVIIVQENRSFDNFFDCFPGTDCVMTAAAAGPQPGPTTPSGPCPDPVPTRTPGPTPSPIQLRFHQQLSDEDIDHTYCPAFKIEYDNGKLDGFYWAGFIRPGVPAKKYPYQVVDEKKIQPYWDLAEQYALADRTFPTQASGSFTAHQDLIAGTTQVSSSASAVDYPLNSENASLWGCDDYKDSHSPLLTTQGGYLPAFRVAFSRTVSMLRVRYDTRLARRQGRHLEVLRADVAEQRRPVMECVRCDIRRTSRQERMAKQA